MSRTINVVNAQKFHIATLHLVILVLSLICVAMWYGWKTAPESLRVILPPDTRYGATIKPGDFDLATVYGFAKLTFTGFNRWVEDGEQEFPKKLTEYQPYFTPKFYGELDGVMQNKASKGELQGRSRYLLDAPGWETFHDEKVKVLDDGSWVVVLRFEVLENLGTMQVKKVTIEYPLHIVRMNVEPDKNAYGLAINGIAPGFEERKVK